MGSRPASWRRSASQCCSSPFSCRESRKEEGSGSVEVVSFEFVSERLKRYDMALIPCTYRKLLQVFVTLILFGSPAWADWPPISPEDLKMADLPEQKGAPAVLLLRDEVADDLNNYHSV